MTSWSYLSPAKIKAKMRSAAHARGDAWTGPTYDHQTHSTATPPTDAITAVQTSTSDQGMFNHVESFTSGQDEDDAEDDDEDEELHCLCRKPEDGKTMIQCDNCDVW